MDTNQYEEVFAIVEKIRSKLLNNKEVFLLVEAVDVIRESFAETFNKLSDDGDFILIGVSGPQFLCAPELRVEFVRQIGDISQIQITLCYSVEPKSEFEFDRSLTRIDHPSDWSQFDEFIHRESWFARFKELQPCRCCVRALDQNGMSDLYVLFAEEMRLREDSNEDPRIIEMSKQVTELSESIAKERKGRG